MNVVPSGSGLLGFRNHDPMRTVTYIEKTHEYYRRKGHADVYRYAENVDGPLTPLAKPLAESRLILVGSAGIQIVPEGGPRPQPYIGRNLGQKDRVEVWDIPADIPAEKLIYVTGAHNRIDSPMTDIDSFYPVTRLRELRDTGEIGELAERHLKIKPCYSQRKTRELDAPEVLRRCRAQAVDVALMVPV